MNLEVASLQSSGKPSQNWLLPTRKEDTKLTQENPIS
jgi:hypothetical protein